VQDEQAGGPICVSIGSGLVRSVIFHVVIPYISRHISHPEKGSMPKDSLVKSPRTRKEKAEQKKEAENKLKCVSDFERSQKIDSLPRHLNTFWRTDTRL